MSEKKPCALESAVVPGAAHEPENPDGSTSHHGPCALLSPDPLPPPEHADDAAVEDESADPVGDGHSDAEWADRRVRDGKA